MARIVNSKWATFGEVLVSVTRPGIVDEDTFQVFLQDLRRDPIKKYLAASIGKPDATSLQRKQIADVLKEHNIRTATVTDDSLTRGLVTAISWLGANIKAFSWSEMKDALRYLEVEEPVASRALDTVARLRTEFEVSLR